jgi:hypothetical protein
LSTSPEDCAFVERHENVLLVGRAGVGKSHRRSVSVLAAPAMTSSTSARASWRRGLGAAALSPRTRTVAVEFASCPLARVVAIVSATKAIQSARSPPSS